MVNQEYLIPQHIYVEVHHSHIHLYMTMWMMPHALLIHHWWKTTTPLHLKDRSHGPTPSPIMVQLAVVWIGSSRTGSSRIGSGGRISKGRISKGLDWARVGLATTLAFALMNKSEAWCTRRNSWWTLHGKKPPQPRLVGKRHRMKKSKIHTINLQGSIHVY